MTTSGLYRAITRRGRQCGLADVTPHCFRRHFSHARLDHGGAEGDLPEEERDIRLIGELA
jgi:integrase